MKSRVLVLVLILNKERPKTNYLDSRDSSEILRIHHIYTTAEWYSISAFVVPAGGSDF